MLSTGRTEGDGVHSPDGRQGAIREARDAATRRRIVRPAIQRAFDWQREHLRRFMGSIMRGSLFGSLAPRLQRGLAEATHAPRDLGHLGRIRVTWLPLLAIGVALCLLAGPGGILAQTQVAPPTVDAVTPGDGALAIAWTAPTGVAGITAYDLRHIRSDAADKADANWTDIEDVWSSGSGDLTYTLADLQNGAGYDVQLRTVTTADGAWSATSTGTPQIPGPVITAVIAGDGALTVAWNAPAVAAATRVTAYDVRSITSAATDKADGAWTVVEGFWTAGSLDGVLAGLTNGTGYDVQVRAAAATDGAWSATATGTPAEHGGTLETATALPLTTRLGGAIASADDVDVFKIVLSAATGIIVSTRGDLDTVGQLLDGDGALLSENDQGDELHGRHNFLLWGSLEAGTYYVRVAGGGGATGAYVLETTTVADTTQRADAQDIEVGGTARGIIDTERTDEDWFRITVTGHTVLLVHTTGPARTWGDLWQSGDRRAQNTDEFSLGGNRFFVRANLSPGTYYVEVGGFAEVTGAYTLHVNRASEPGSSIAAAQPLVPLFPKAGTISPADDVDYFRIELARATHVLLAAAGSAVPIAGELLDADGNPVDANIRESRYSFSPSAPAGFTLQDRLEAGTHYLKVTRLPGSPGPATGRYGLRMYEDYVYGEFFDGCTALTASLADPLSDPLSGCQWHLENTGQLGGTPGEDINVREVWAAGHLGEGATVVLVDNGMDVGHPDLAPNVIADRNYGYGGAAVYNPGNTHGTGAAGLIAARDNDIGVRGIAPRAQIYVYNIIDAFSHAYAADAMTRGMETTAISNNSWSVTEGPGYAAASSGWERAVVRGVTEGYGGKGVLYVRSGGNDAVLGANANLSGFRNHYTTMAACAVTDHGVRSHYSEQGANLWVCAPSGASYLPAAITTTLNDGRYRNTYGGTSATAAIVSGVSALLRGAYADLTWRDVKLILAGSARKNDPSNTGWEEGALQYGSTTERYTFNHEYGFGVVDAKAAMDLAAGWTSLPPLPPLTEESQASGDVDLAVPDLPSPGTPTSVTAGITMGAQVQSTEFVEIHLNLTATAFRDLEIELVSPSGTVSVLSPYYLVGPGECKSLFGILPGKCNLDGSVRLGSAKHLGEDPAGDWTLRITDHVHGGAAARLNAWNLTVYGHRTSPAAPAIDAVAAGGESLTVTWTAPADTGTSAITAYDLRSILTSADETVDANWTVVQDAWTTGSGDLAHVVTGLTGNAEYDVQVRGVNASGDGLWSDTATGTPTTDEAPTIDALSPGDRSIAVAWTAPTNADLGTVTAYDLRYIRADATNKADGNWTVVSAVWTAGSLAYTLNPTSSPLVNGVSYDVQVRAVVGTDPYPWSGVHAATPRTTPGAPTIDAVTGSVSALTAAWSAPASDGGDAITSYDLRSIKTGDDETVDGNWTVATGVWSAAAPDLASAVTGLDTGTQYDVQVRAVNGAGAGPWSATSVGVTRPGAPAVDAATGVVGGLTVGWSAPATDGDAAATSYDLRSIKTSADAAVDANWAVETGVWSAGDLTATVTGLALGTEYDVQVRAVNAAGAGPWSATRAGTTLFSDDATLTGLTLSGVRLTPGFTSGGTSYEASVGYTVTGATVAATRSDGNAAVVILDGNGNTLASADTVAVDLSVGENIIRVRVTAQDGVATVTYTVTVRRTAQDLSLTPPASDPVAPFASTAVYTIQFQGDWTTAATPDGVPGGAHFSRLIGAVHNAGVTFLESGGAASPGVESMAEVGGTSRLRNAVTNAGAHALSVIQGGTNSIGPTALQSLTVTLSTDHPRVTLVTMIAPSPDWFVGVSGLPLLDSGGAWRSSVEVDLYPWDAGTESGGEFSLSNPATSPRGVITSIRGAGKFSTGRIATLTFTLDSVNFAPTGTPFITGITGAPEVGEALTADTSGIDDRNGLTSPGYAHQWLRGNSGGQASTISGATTATYRVQPADVGRQLTVRVSFTDDDSTMEELTSDATEAVIVTQVTVSFGAGGYAAEEGGQRATVQVQLDKDPHRTLRVPLRATTGGGAGAPDYAAPTQITFGPGETEKDAHVTAADDLVDDDGESVTLAFGDLPDGVSAGGPSETVIHIIDDDYVPVTLGWEETAFTAEEPTSPGARTAVALRAAAVTATDKRPESGFTLAFTVRTANGTARQPEDYEELSSTGTFDRDDFFRRTMDGQFRWVASADFTVTVAHDTVDEPLERFTVRLAFAGAGQPHLSLGEATATVTVTDDVASLADLQTTVFANPSAVEPGGQLTYDWSVHNSGPAAATSTVLTGALDGGVTFVSAQVTTPATGQCGRSGRRVTCTVGTLEVGDTATGEIVVQVRDSASADMGFTAVAGADQLDRTPADNDDAVTTALDAPPGQVTDLRATGASGHIDVTWSPPGDNGSAVTGYALERKAGTDDYAPVFPRPPQGTTSYRDENVLEDTEYTYRLRALNEDGAAAWSNEPVARLLPPPPPVSSGGGNSGGGGGGGGGGGFGPAPVAPKFSEGFRTTRSLAENALAGDAVGDPVAATHPDDLAIAYALSGTDAAAFTVDAATGQIRVTEGVALEVGRTYTVNLTATDSAGFGAIIIVAIEVAEAMHHRYDLNRNGTIEKDEVLEAVADYFAGRIEKDEVLALVTRYFAG